MLEDSPSPSGLGGAKEDCLPSVNLCLAPAIEKASLVLALRGVRSTVKTVKLRPTRAVSTGGVAISGNAERIRMQDRRFPQ